MALLPALAITATGEAGHGSGAGVLALILVALVAGLIWVFSLYVHPFTGCGACGGSGLNKGSTGKRFGMCKSCGGSRRKQRLGSKTLHRWARTAAAEWRRTRALKREERVKERTRNPREFGGRK
jgi:hypothetical protein